MSMNRVELLKLFETTAAEVVEKDFKNVSEGTVISELGIDRKSVV